MTGKTTPILLKGRKEDCGNYQPVSLTSVPGKIIEQILLKAMLKHMRDKEVIQDSWHSFTKDKSCLRGGTADVSCLDLCKIFETVPNSTLLGGRNWLDGHIHRIVVNGPMSRWRLVTSGVFQGPVLDQYCQISSSVTWTVGSK